MRIYYLCERVNRKKEESLFEWKLIEGKSFIRVGMKYFVTFIYMLVRKFFYLNQIKFNWVNKIIIYESVNN